MIRLGAPAKLNLHLRVLGLRGDGFHSIETLFVRLGLQDEVELELGHEGLRFEATGEFEVPRGNDNLCVAAAESFYREIGVDPAARIRLMKRIPVAAGLGGGSSDAASVLMGLNDLLGTPLGPASLARVGGRIGSDVPFFLMQRPFALARGRGEDLSPLPPPESRSVLIVVPDFGVSAGEAYAWHREVADGSPVEDGPGEALAVTAALSDWSAIAAISANDLAPGVFARHPSLAVTADALADTGAFMSLLCGSGACLAGLYHDVAIRDLSIERLRSHPAILPGWRLISTWTEGPGA